MIDRNRRRDLTIRMRHKDGGLVVHDRQVNRRERYQARVACEVDRREAEVELRLARQLDHVLHDLWIEYEAEHFDLTATTTLLDGTQTLPWDAL